MKNKQLMRMMLLSLLVCPTMQSTQAQQLQRIVQPPGKDIPTNSPSSSDDNGDAEYLRRYPLLGRTALPGQRFFHAPTPPKGGDSRPSAVPRKSRKAPAAGRELWGNIVSRTSWGDSDTQNGIYSFNATSPLAFEAIATNYRMEANGGSAFVNGVWHLLYFYKSWGVTLVYHYSFDAETWELIDSGTKVSKNSLLASETATAADGTVYGAFYNSEGTGFELGIIDYNKLERTTIGPLTQHYVALGVTADKTLYGVAATGDVYRISSADAKETRIGSTGVKLVASDGTTYLQSGEIDSKTGVFYWAAVDADKKSALYTVSTSDGKPTKVADFADDDVVLGLTVPRPEAEDGAPEAIADLNAAFDGPSLTGTFTFTAPDKTFDGRPLDGSLTYYVGADDDTLASGTTQAGTKVSQKVSLPANGLYRFNVTTRNSVGPSPKVKLVRYVGYDTPNQPADAQLTIDPDNGKAQLKWTPPRSGLNNAYLGELRYDVMRYPDSLLVGKAVADTVFTETLPKEQLKFYKYGITALNDTMRSRETVSNGAAYGAAMPTPYFEDFSKEESFSFFTVIDANADKRTWGWYWGRRGESPSARYTYSSANNADDWLISPRIALTGGREYTVAFKARTSTSKYSVEEERFELKCGTGTTAEAMSQTLIPPTVITNDTDSVISATIYADKDREINLGIHAISDSYKYYWFVDDLSVDGGELLSTPDSVQTLAVVRGEDGAATARLSFTLPTVDRKGDALKAAMTMAVVLRNDSVALDTLTEGLTPGVSLTWEDKDVPQGLNHYTVVPYNSDGRGRAISRRSVFIGLDKPEAPDESSIKAVDKVTQLDLSWAAVERGANGGYVDPEELWYTIYKIDKSSREQLDSIKGKTAYTVVYGDEAEQAQTVVRYGVSAKNATGESTVASSRYVVTGKAYALPFAETFADGKHDNALWWTPNSITNSQWGTVTAVPGSRSDGALAFLGKGDTSEMNTGKIALGDAKTPKFVFSVAPDSAFTARIHVYAELPDGSADSLTTVDLADFGSQHTWRRVTVGLDNYVSQPYIILSLRGEGTTQGYAYVDSMYVRDFRNRDLGLTMKAPSLLRKGRNATVSVTVANNGLATPASYTVSLKAGDTPVDSREVTTPLAPMADSTFVFAYKPSVFLDEETLVLTAEVTSDGEENPSDNTATADATVSEPKNPAPSSAAAEEKEGAVKVSWTAPADPKSIVSDGFEDYESWSTDAFGGWTGYDGDKGESGSLFRGYPYKHMGEPFAFIVFAPDEIDESITGSFPSFAPKSGRKYAASVYSSIGETYPDADNWLISPPLSGESQTVSFYANNYYESPSRIFPEDAALLYSTGSTDPADFVAVDTVTISTGQWTEVKFDVPEGARRFAIRHITKEGGYALLVDDVSYQEGMGEVTGYNVYADGTFVASVGPEESSYTDTKPTGDGEITYSVTAVYADGESAPAFAEPIVVTGITRIESDEAAKSDVYSLDGKLVRRATAKNRPLAKGVYIVGGRKVTVR